MPTKSVQPETWPCQWTAAANNTNSGLSARAQTQCICVHDYWSTSCSQTSLSHLETANDGSTFLEGLNKISVQHGPRHLAGAPYVIVTLTITITG